MNVKMELTTARKPVRIRRAVSDVFVVRAIDGLERHVKVRDI
jgi:hypothetical protein